MAMGLNTDSTGGGDFTPIVKIDARAGRVFRVDRAQNGGEWETTNVEITDEFTAIWDMEHIEVGWALFAAGVAPLFTLVKLGEPLPAKPSDQHKQVFRLMLKLGKSAGGDVRELASQAKAVIGSVDKLHDAYIAGAKENAGKLPIVQMTGSTPIVSTGKGQSSTNYAPVFAIVGWAARPSDLGGLAPAGSHPTTDPLPKTDPPAAAAKKKATVDVQNEF
jgi:hypothetical protein